MTLESWFKSRRINYVDQAGSVGPGTSIQIVAYLLTYFRHWSVEYPSCLGEFPPKILLILPAFLHAYFYHPMVI